MSRCVLKTTQTCSTSAGFATAASPALASVSAECTSISENKLAVRLTFGCKGEPVRRSANSRCRNSPSSPAVSLMNTPCWPFHFAPVWFGRVSTSAIFVQAARLLTAGFPATLPYSV